MKGTSQPMERGREKDACWSDCAHMFVMCTHVRLHVLCMSLQNLGGGITANFSPRTHTLLPRSPSMDLHPSSMQRVMW